MNKETTYRFVQITDEVIEKLDSYKEYIIIPPGTNDLFKRLGGWMKVYYVHIEGAEILLPVEEKLPYVLNNGMGTTTIMESNKEEKQVSKEEVTIKELRNKFFKECADRNEGQLPRVNTAPHDLFNWFKPYLKEDIK